MVIVASISPTKMPRKLDWQSTWMWNEDLIPISWSSVLSKRSDNFTDAGSNRNIRKRVDKHPFMLNNVESTSIGISVLTFSWIGIPKGRWFDVVSIGSQFFAWTLIDVGVDVTVNANHQNAIFDNEWIQIRCELAMYSIQCNRFTTIIINKFEWVIWMCVAQRNCGWKTNFRLKKIQ